MKIVGYRRNDFTTNDGKQITGCNVYIATEIDPRNGSGMSVERTYLSDSKLAREGIDLSAILNHEIKVYYNRYGRVDSIVVVD